MHIYDKFFGEYGAVVGQILLTKDDVDRPNVKHNLLGTFLTLLELGVIPVVNENDSVCIEEIESEHKIFGDNDMLSAVVAALVDADLLIILSDIDGLYDGDPRRIPTRVLSGRRSVRRRGRSVRGRRGQRIRPGRDDDEGDRGETCRRSRYRYGHHKRRKARGDLCDRGGRQRRDTV
jgi:glutamate 5-kinase